MGTQSSEDHLKSYINDKEYKDGNNDQNNNQEKEVLKDLGTIKELEFISMDISELPCSIFYPAGTSVLIRAAKVTEIQAFSMVDDTNFYDVYEKVNKIISTCVFMKDPSGKSIPYTNLVDGDRWYLLFVIRDLTFQNGKDLYTEVGETKIPLKRGYFEFFEMDEKLKKYYDKVGGKFSFESKNNGTIDMAPPTLGLQKSFTDYMIKKVQAKKDLDQSFLKIIPYTLVGRLSITEEGIDSKLKEFRELDLNLFQFLNQSVEKMSFGIKGVMTVDESGQEVRSDTIFPEGVSGLFVQHDAFDEFLK